jgi:diaminopropionate ammonia-lyase
VFTVNFAPYKKYIKRMMFIMEKIQWIKNSMPKTDNKNLEVMSLENVNKAKKFHQSFPQYKQTPLVHLGNMSKYLGLKNVFVKDESYRFGLNAFKVLGGSFAMAQYIASKIGCDVLELPYETLISDEIKDSLGEITFFTATDGNHGRGVAWAANKIGQKAVVRMPKGSSQVRLNNILNEGADATIEEVNYDECVRIAAKEADVNPNDVIIQDTAWEGYEEIPSWIMQGYGTMAKEASEQLKEFGIERPTHIFVQAGVGSLAGAVQGFFKNLFPDNCPTTVIVEAKEADCLYRSAKDGSGDRVFVDGDMQTIMAGLACGEANTISWDILKNNSSFFVSCPDWVSASGMRMLAAPIKGDTQVISGESGAVSMGLLAAIMNCESLKGLKDALKIDENSSVLLFSTEGDTDPKKYKEIVWGGEYPLEDSFK